MLFCSQVLVLLMYAHINIQFCFVVVACYLCLIVVVFNRVVCNPSRSSCLHVLAGTYICIIITTTIIQNSHNSLFLCRKISSKNRQVVVSFIV